MKQKIVTIIKRLKDAKDSQIDLDSNLEEWLQNDWQIKQVVSTAFQHQSSGTGNVTSAIAITLLLEKK